MTARPRLLATLLAAGVAWWPGRATAANARALECANASEQGQRARDEGRLRAARDDFASCASADCPAFVRKDCTQWLADVDAAFPSIVVSVRGAQGDLTAVRILVDGAVVRDKLDGEPIPIEPGSHVLRVEPAAGGPVEQRLLVRLGEKNRLVDVTVGPVAAAPGAERPPASESGERHASLLRPAGYVIGGIGVVGLGLLAYFGIASISDGNHLRSTCAPACAQNDVDKLKTEEVAADVSMAVGILGVAAGVALVIWGGERRATSTGHALILDVGPTSGGGIARLSGAF